MRVPDLDTIDTLYKCVSQCVIRRHGVDYGELGKFSSSLNMFRSRTGESSNDAYWQEYFSQLRRLRFELCAAPMSVEHRYHRIAETKTRLADHLRHCNKLYPSFAQPAAEIVSLLDGLGNDNRNPLLDSLVELTAPTRSTAWVVKESRFVPLVEDAFGPFLTEGQHIQFLHYSQLASDICYDALIVIGSPIWFPVSVFTAPRAAIVEIVHYSWMADSWKLSGTFIADYRRQSSRQTINEGSFAYYEARSPADSILPNVDTRRVAEVAASSERHDYDEIDARCILFEGETAMFVATEQSSSILVIDLEEREQDRVRNVSVDDLTPGTFVLVRTGGGGDYIIPIADEIMGNQAVTSRSVQNEWKALLRAYVMEHGLLATSIDLIDLGSDIANETNVRNWMYPRNIKTRDEADFAAIMRLVGLKARTAEIWQKMEFISSAHRKAGFQLRKILLSLVDQIPTDEFRRKGKIDLRLAEDNDEAKLTAFRIEGILPDTYKVSFSQIGIPFKVEQ